MLHTLVVGLNVNCYIIASELEDEAIIIDPGAEARRIFDVIEERQLSTTAVICTHGHFDHIGGVAELVELTGAEVFIHRGDARYMEDATLNLSGYIDAPASIAVPTRPVEDGQILKLGEMRLKVLHTPGHTPGSISILVGEAVFCGDLIFAGSVGRVDFPGGSWEALSLSVREKIFTLPERLILYPGHGSSTTIGEEKKYNPYFGSRN